MDQVEVPLVFGGMNTVDPPSSLMPEESFEIRNWVPYRGGLRPRVGWSKFTETGMASLVACRGIVTEFYETANVQQVIMAVSNEDATPDWTLYSIDVDDLAAGSWTAIDGPILVGSTTGDTRYLAFAVGDGKLLFSNREFPSNRARYWDGAAAAQIATDDTAGLAHAYHLNRWWTIGAEDEPSFLKFTEIGDITNWNVSENFIPVGDGNVFGTDLCVYDRGMLIGKGDGIWWLGGSTRDTWQLLPLSKLPVHQGRAFCKSPYGVFVMGANGFLYLWDGGDVQPVGHQHQVTTGSGAGFAGYGGQVSLAWSKEKLYIAKTFAEVSVYSPAEDSWVYEYIGANAARYPVDYMASMNEELLLTGPESEQKTTWPGAFRSDTMSANQESLDEEEDGDYYFIGGVQLPDSPMRKVTLHSIHVQYRMAQNLGGVGTGSGLDVKVYDVNNTEPSITKTIGKKAVGQTHVERADFGIPISGFGFSVEFASTPTEAESDIYQIQKATAVLTVDDRKARR